MLRPGKTAISPAMGIQDLVRWLIPREDHFYDFLERQAVVAHKGVLALNGLSTGTAAETSKAVQAFEHEGDKIVHEMEEALAKTFVTPIDREDLQKLSSELDDILDRANGAARSCVLLGVDKATEPMAQMIALLSKCTEALTLAIPKLRKHAYGELVEDARGLRKLEKEGDLVYRQAISKLFHDPAIEAKTLIREKDILEHLENAIDHCDHIANTLMNLAVKHG